MTDCADMETSAVPELCRDTTCAATMERCLPYESLIKPCLVDGAGCQWRLGLELWNVRCSDFRDKLETIRADDALGRDTADARLLHSAAAALLFGADPGRTPAVLVSEASRREELGRAAIEEIAAAAGAEVTDFAADDLALIPAVTVLSVFHVVKH
jgi:hypothetical protein